MPALKMGIGKKITFSVVTIFLLFSAVLLLSIGFASSENLTVVKQDELNRMSQILARRLSAMEQNAVRTTLDFESNDRIVAEIQLLSRLGPYYADPGSYFPEEFFADETPIEEADQIFALQAQLNLIQILQSTKNLNDLSAISFYLLSPFDLVSGAPPVLALRLDDENLLVSRFERKGDIEQPQLYRAAANEFQPPPPDYFDISSAYAAPPAEFYDDLGFEPFQSDTAATMFQQEWQGLTEPYSEIIILETGVPVIYTWYPVKVSLADPETWTPEQVSVGVALVEQQLDEVALAALQTQLGLDVALARDGKLLLDSTGNIAAGASLQSDDIINFQEASYYYAQQPLDFSAGQSSDLNAVVLSPVSELTQLTEDLLLRIILLAFITILITSLLVYVSLQYLITTPLQNLMQGVQIIADGDLTHQVAVKSKDELGEFAHTFNQMTTQLHETEQSLRTYQNHLEDLVEARTEQLQETNQDLQHEIAEREQTQERLAEERNLLRVLIDNIPYQIYIKDTECRFMMANETCLQALNQTEEELLGKTDFDLFPPEVAQEFYEDEQRVLKRGQAVLNQEELHVDSETGERTWYVSSKVPFHDAQGQIVGFVGVTRDVTQRKQAEMTLQTANQELTRLNEDKDRFFSIVAHDLKGPFTPLLGNAEFLTMMADTLEPDEVREMGASIHRSAKNVYDLLENLLQWARMQMGRMEYQPEKCNLTWVVQQNIKLLSDNAEKKKITLNNELTSTIYVSADVNMLTTILRNLISNAVKFTQMGGSVTVTAETTAPSECSFDYDCLLVSVQDTGVGIEKEDLEKLFSIQTHHSTLGTDNEQGTGLGLIMCQEMVMTNGGKIWATSEPGVGTTFSFTIPLDASTSLEDIPAASQPNGVAH